MIPEIGLYCLIMALCVACVQSFVPLLGSYHQKIGWMEFGKATAFLQFFFIVISFCCLVYSFLKNDFTVAYIAQNSNSHLPLIYRFCAVWGAHEGSLLLWALILSFWTFMVSLFSHEIPLVLKTRVLSVLAMVSVGFLLFLLLTSNPFQRLLTDIPLEGRDLNPLLQDPGLAIHPPMLYMGYVGFSVAFAFAIAALISGEFNPKWAGWARSWSLIAWSFLTLGITLGSWWAYRVLGWGGWWFWDPVENASFLPWLSGTALIHSLIVAQKRNVFKAWTVLLAIITFSLSLMGTFLVRSGILVSVHSFAQDPTRGAFLLQFLTLVVGGSLLLYAFKGHKIQNSGIFQLWSKETMLLTNNVILTVAMFTVLLGTLYPLIIDALGLGKLSVGPPYFNSVFVPIMLPLIFLIGVGPALAWQNSQLILVIRRFKYTLLLSLSLALLLPVILVGKINFAILLGLFLGFWIILATLQHSFTGAIKRPIHQLRLGMFLGHIGFAICVIGIVLAQSYSLERDVRMQPKDTLNIGPYRLQFIQVYKIKGPNYTGYTSEIEVQRNASKILLHPELRVFNTQKMALPKTAIHVAPFHDLYIALGDPLENDAWSFRIYYKPFIRFIWLGGLIMMLGGFIAVIIHLRQGRRIKAEGKND